MKTQNSVIMSDPAYEYILNQILNKEIKPGDRIPEKKIAEDLHISRTPVRNAIKQLEAEDLVIIHPNRFAEAATYDENKIQNIGIMRVAIDSMAVRLCIFRGSNEDFQKLRLTAQKCDRIDAGADKLAKVRGDYDFHYQLSTIAKNPVLEKYQALLLRQMEVLLAYNYIVLKSASVKHVAIADAIIKRDEVLATRLLIRHISEFYHLSDSYPFIKNPLIFKE